MKLLIIWLLISLTPIRSVYSPDTEATILGTWFAPDLDRSTIRVYRARNGLIYGKIIESANEDWVGEIVLKEVRYDSQAETWKGEVYSLTMYFTVDVELTLLDADRLQVVGTRFLMSKTFYWERV